MRLHPRVVVGSPTARILSSRRPPAPARERSGWRCRLPLHRPSTDDWPGFRGDASGRASASRVPSATRSSRWTFQAAGSVNRNIAVAGDLVLAPSDDGLLHALRADGRERWTYPAAGRCEVADGRAVADGAAHPRAGLRDRRQVGARSRSYARAPPMGGHLYVGTGEGESWRWTPRPARELAARHLGLRRCTTLALADGRVFAVTHGDAMWRSTRGTASPVDDVDATGQARSSRATAWSSSARAAMPRQGTFARSTSRRARAVERRGIHRRSGDRRWRGLRRRARSHRPPSIRTGRRALAMPVRRQRSRAAVADVVLRALRRRARGRGARRRDRWRAVALRPRRCRVVYRRRAWSDVFVGTDAGTVYAIGGDGAAITPGPIPSLASTAPTSTAAPAPSPAAVLPPPPSSMGSGGIRDPLRADDITLAPDGMREGTRKP